MDKTSTDASQKIAESSELRQAAKALEKLLEQGEEAAWKIGACYNRIIDQKLAEKSGYRHARDFFASRFPRVSQATLTHYGAVARAFSEETAGDYGVSLLTTLLTYEKLAGVKPNDANPASVQIIVPGAKKALRFADCHRAELLKAIKAFKGHSGDKGAMKPEETKLLKQLRDALGEDSPIALSSRQGRDGAHVVFTLSLNEDQLGLLLNALLRVLRGTEAQEKAQKTMQDFTKEFAKGIDKWARSIKKPEDLFRQQD